MSTQLRPSIAIASPRTVTFAPAVPDVAAGTSGSVRALDAAPGSHATPAHPNETASNVGSSSTSLSSCSRFVSKADGSLFGKRSRRCTSRSTRQRTNGCMASRYDTLSRSSPATCRAMVPQPSAGPAHSTGTSSAYVYAPSVATRGIGWMSPCAMRAGPAGCGSYASSVKRRGTWTDIRCVSPATSGAVRSTSGSSVVDPLGGRSSSARRT